MERYGTDFDTAIKCGVGERIVGGVRVLDIMRVVERIETVLEGVIQYE